MGACEAPRCVAGAPGPVPLLPSPPLLTAPPHVTEATRIYRTAQPGSVPSRRPSPSHSPCVPTLWFSRWPSSDALSSHHGPSWLSWCPASACPACAWVFGAKPWRKWAFSHQGFLPPPGPRKAPEQGRSSARGLGRDRSSSWPVGGGSEPLWCCFSYAPSCAMAPCLPHLQ